jgi:hypothetical protein
MAGQNTQESVYMYDVIFGVVVYLSNVLCKLKLLLVLINPQVQST